MKRVLKNRTARSLEVLTLLWESEPGQAYRPGDPAMAAEGTHRREFQVTGTAGSNFAGGRGNVSLYLDYTRRTAQPAEDASLYGDGPPAVSAFGRRRSRRRRQPRRGRRARLLSRPGRTSRSSTGLRHDPLQPRHHQALTSSAGAFYNAKAMPIRGFRLHRLSADTCLGSGTRATGIDAALGSVSTTRPGTTVSPRINRYNSFASAHYDISDSVTLYGEAGLLLGAVETRAIQPPTINLNAIVTPGLQLLEPVRSDRRFPTLQTTSTASPASVTIVLYAGLAVRLSTYRFVDAGKQRSERHQLAVALPGAA